MFDPRLERLREGVNAPNVTRILFQLEYAHELSKMSGGTYDSIINQVIAYLSQSAAEQGLLTPLAVQQAEASLSALSAQAKRYSILCVAHAHIDMNWMWRWDETVAITLDTFRTMLDLMKEYPEFTFSQSQASVYAIVERYAPEMLNEIRHRIRAGQWEVSASTWVEADKNMPVGESHARHLLYTRRYLSELLGLLPDQFQLDYEPDTFGHHANVPEILASGGVRYYYHCRGDNGDLLYRWLSPSGKSVLVYREPTWYLGAIEPNMALYVPSFCQAYGLQSMLKVYGVGDHGGGPTRRDIERLRDMATWPVFPTIRFSTYGEFFKQVETVADHLPEVTGELNFVFTGCYSSQSRIKRANRLAEASLYSAEAYAALAALDGARYPALEFTQGWKNTLFNQFHDIIPGSGVIDTREYALGLFQETLATASSARRHAFQALLPAQAEPGLASLERMDTTGEGAGVGYGVEDFRFSQVSRSGGLQRVFHVFNPSAWPRQEIIELVVWDWQGDLQRLVVQDEAGGVVPHQALDRGWNNYWGHQFLRLLVKVKVPALGYTSLLLTQSEAILDSKRFPQDSRSEQAVSLRLENEFLAATFDRSSCALVSLVDRQSGMELLDRQRPAVFRRILEDDSQGMTAWVVGRYIHMQELTRGARLLKFEPSGDLRKWLTYETNWGESRLKVTVSLESGSHRLDYALECDWIEPGRQGLGIPQLNFHLPLGYAIQAYRYDIPFGTVDRQPLPLDVPANSWGAALPKGGQSPFVQLISQGSYGFRGVEDSLALTLLRSSYDPDPFPELGRHKMFFSIRINPTTVKNIDLIQAAFDILHPLDVVSSGALRLSRVSYLELEGDSAVLSTLKMAEDGSGLILRLYETDGMESQVTLHFAKKVIQAEWVDLHEQPTGDPTPIIMDSERLHFSLKANSLGTIKIIF
jgi:alpha-mannosidase